ncbi:hypothetical protein AVEN_165766-1 [Araneus ventricosus]|uniref:Uncharacterized protein n=1 Tax=Araneus ventricosus TaxID=182803 RepID=A0A4Y2WKY1_ARAVE|nr:hypothetical protein AVEN_165766-1 [Araneus ventricosus]
MRSSIKIERTFVSTLLLLGRFLNGKHYIVCQVNCANQPAVARCSVMPNNYPYLGGIRMAPIMPRPAPIRQNTTPFSISMTKLKRHLHLPGPVA